MDDDQSGPLGLHHATGLLDPTRHGQAGSGPPMILNCHRRSWRNRSSCASTTMFESDMNIIPRLVEPYRLRTPLGSDRDRPTRPRSQSAPRVPCVLVGGWRRRRLLFAATSVLHIPASPSRPAPRLPVHSPAARTTRRGRSSADTVALLCRSHARADCAGNPGEFLAPIRPPTAWLDGYRDICEFARDIYWNTRHISRNIDMERHAEDAAGRLEGGVPARRDRRVDRAGTSASWRPSSSGPRSWRRQLTGRGASRPHG